MSLARDIIDYLWDWFFAACRKPIFYVRQNGTWKRVARCMKRKV
jgi:hypothetical protein